MFGLPSFCEAFYSNHTTDGTCAFQGFEINEILFQGKSDYQKMAIYTNDELKKVLVLDGIIQTTTSDEFIYHEMMTHVPLFSHSNPKKALIIGGGDGGCLREVLRHKTLEKVVMVDIDKMVIDACVEHLPEINLGGDIYKDPRTELIINDAAEFIKTTDDKFDVIIIDSTDCFGVGERLFTYEFYKQLKSILSDEGYISCQGGVPFFQKGNMGRTIHLLQQAEMQAGCYISVVPTYYGGYAAFGYASNKTEEISFSLDDLDTRFEKAKIETRHYTPEIHLASFVLPPWLQEYI